MKRTALAMLLLVLVSTFAAMGGDCQVTADSHGIQVDTDHEDNIWEQLFGND